MYVAMYYMHIVSTYISLIDIHIMIDMSLYNIQFFTHSSVMQSFNGELVYIYMIKWKREQNIGYLT